MCKSWMWLMIVVSSGLLLACSGGTDAPGADAAGDDVVAAPDTESDPDVAAERDALVDPDVATVSDVAEDLAVGPDVPATIDIGVDVGADVPIEEPGVCTLAEDDTDPDSVARIGCRADYEAVAAPPLVASIPGALSAKTVIETRPTTRPAAASSSRPPRRSSKAT